MRNQTFYAHRNKKGFYEHVYPHPRQTAMCSPEGRPVFTVKVREVEEGEKSHYWGWYDSEKDEYQMVYPSKYQVEICFPYGPKAAEEKGRGRLVNLVIEEMDEVPA